MKRIYFYQSGAGRAVEDFKLYPSGQFGAGLLSAPKWQLLSGAASVTNLEKNEAIEVERNALAMGISHAEGPGLRYKVQTAGKRCRVLVPRSTNEGDKRFIMAPNSVIGRDGYIAFYYSGGSIIAGGSTERADGGFVQVPEFTPNTLASMALSTTESSWVELYIPYPLLPSSYIEWRVWGYSQPRPAAPGFQLRHADGNLNTSDTGELRLTSIANFVAYLEAVEVVSP